MSDPKKPPQKIFPTENGPYRYYSDPETGEELPLVNSKEEKIPAEPEVYLCRCGGSGNKPFCDGTHKTNNFSDKKLTDGEMDKRDTYAGKEVTVHDNRGICAHQGFCSDGAPKVFRQDAEPWIDADGQAGDETIRVIRQCPSGALSYSLDGVEHRDLDMTREPVVKVSKDGPYYVSGHIEVVGHEPRAEEVSTEHATLCRCGHSKNKPFCDGTHWYVEFKDPKN
jgi:CDGSH-type Zn-finger protein